MKMQVEVCNVCYRRDGSLTPAQPITLALCIPHAKELTHATPQPTKKNMPRGIRWKSLLAWLEAVPPNQPFRLSVAQAALHMHSQGHCFNLLQRAIEEGYLHKEGPLYSTATPWPTTPTAPRAFRRPSPHYDALVAWLDSLDPGTIFQAQNVTKLFRFRSSASASQLLHRALREQRITKTGNGRATRFIKVDTHPSTR